MSFKPAQRKSKKIKMAIQGPAGAGKTFTALSVAKALVARTDPGKRIAVIDTEKSADMYAPPFEFEIDNDFGEGPSLSYHPDKLIEKLEAARKAGIFGAVIVDSFSHFWEGKGGFLTMHADIGARQKAKGQKEDSWGNWKFIDPAYDGLWTYIRNYPLHVILCLRSEEKTEKNSDGKIEKVGLAAIFRKKWEYEVDIQFAVVNEGSTMVAWKHRLGSFLTDKVFTKPGENVAEAIMAWQAAGAPEVLMPDPDEPVMTDAAKIAGAAVEALREQVGAKTVSITAAIAEAAPVPGAVDVTDGPPPDTERGGPAIDQAALFIAMINAAATTGDLKSVGEEIKKARNDKLLTQEEYNGKLSPAFANKNRELKKATQ